MGLNIKSGRAHELARTLSRVTGKSMTAVVEEALEERLAKLDRVRPAPGENAWLERSLKEHGSPSQGLTIGDRDLNEADLVLPIVADEAPDQAMTRETRIR